GARSRYFGSISAKQKPRSATWESEEINELGSMTCPPADTLTSHPTDAKVRMSRIPDKITTAPQGGPLSDGLAGFAAPAGLIEEPPPALGLVDPVLDQARRGHIPMLVAQVMRLAQMRDELEIVLAQLRQHVERRHEIGVVVLDALQAADMADR